MVARLASTDEAATRMQADAYAAWDAGDEKKGNQLHDHMMRAVNGGTALCQKLQQLRQPAEVDRRVMARMQNLASRARLDAWHREQAEELGDDE